jgi:iron(III) transport system substrate-binding protein
MDRAMVRALAVALLVVVGCGPAPVSSPAATTVPSKPAATSAQSDPAATTAPSKPASGGAADLTAARAEGSLSWYTSTPQTQADRIAAMFEQKTGIKVQVFRSGGEAVLQRFLTEQDAGKNATDVLTTSDQAAFMKLAREGKLLTYQPAGWELVPDAFKDKDGAWISQRLNMLVPTYRTDKVPDPPKSWKDLASPRFKGQLITPDPAFTSITYLIVQKLSTVLGWDYFKQLAANDMMIVQGNAQVAQALLGGERTVALSADISALSVEMAKGAQIALITPEEGSFLISSPQGIPAKAAHPNAARAFMDFNLTPEVQNLFVSEGLHSPRTDLPAPKGFPEIKALKILEIDYAAAETDSKKVKDQFAEIFH